jgi:hypothetical protein
MEPIKTYVQGQEIGCELNTTQTCNCTTVIWRALCDQTLLHVKNIKGQRDRKYKRGKTPEIWQYVVM